MQQPHFRIYQDGAHWAWQSLSDTGRVLGGGYAKNRQHAAALVVLHTVRDLTDAPLKTARHGLAA